MERIRSTHGATGNTGVPQKVHQCRIWPTNLEFSASGSPVPDKLGPFGRLRSSRRVPRCHLQLDPMCPRWGPSITVSDVPSITDSAVAPSMPPPVGSDVPSLEPFNHSLGCHLQSIAACLCPPAHLAPSVSPALLCSALAGPARCGAGRPAFCVFDLYPAGCPTAVHGCWRYRGGSRGVPPARSLICIPQAVLLRPPPVGIGGFVTSTHRGRC